MKNKKLFEKLALFGNYIQYTQESNTLFFDCRGADIYNSNYKGDIFNYRPVALLDLNNIKIVVEVGATGSRRTKHKTTKRPILHPVQKDDDNGLYISYSVEDCPTFEKSSYYGYHFVKQSFHTGSDWLRDNLPDGESYHTTKNLLHLVNSELKTRFKKVIYIDRSENCYLTVTEALKDEFIRNFDSHPMTQEEEIALTFRAKLRFEMLQYIGIIPKEKRFSDEYCWITSSGLQGIYFPNLSQYIRCIVFGVYGRVVAVFND